MGGKNVTPNEDIVETNEDKTALEKGRSLRKSFNFNMINVEPGTILNFAKDTNITCEVYNDKQVKFRDNITSLTKAALTIVHEMGYDWQTIQGPRWWLLKGKTLSDIRNEYES